jgi:hypothetical protein
MEKKNINNHSTTSESEERIMTKYCGVLIEWYKQSERANAWGFLSQIGIFGTAEKDLTKEDFELFCQSVFLKKDLDRKLLRNFGQRLKRLESQFGDQLHALLLWHLLISDGDEFETFITNAANQHGSCATGLFLDCANWTEDRISDFKNGKPEVDIFGLKTSDFAEAGSGSNA